MCTACRPLTFREQSTPVGISGSRVNKVTVVVLRRTALMLGLLSAFFVLASVAPLAPRSSSPPVSACGSACQHHHLGDSHTPLSSCVHDAGCGGGAALGFGNASLVLFVATPVALVAAALVRRRVRSHVPSMRTTDLLGGVFRPPRLRCI